MSADQSVRSDRMVLYKKKMDSLVLYIRTGCYPPGIDKAEKKSIRCQRKTHHWDPLKNELHYSHKNGSSRRVILTNEEVSDILIQYHSNPPGGHSGVTTTYYKIAEHYFWHGMKEDITNFISSCEKCQVFEKIKTQAPVLNPIKVTETLELVGMDLIGPLPTTENGAKYILTFTDYFTKFVDIYALKDKSAKGVSLGIKSFVCRWGAPRRLLSDQGREFVAKINDEVCKTFQIKRSVTSAYHPQTNGLDERTNQTVKTRLSKLANDHQNNWDEYLEDVAFSIRTQRQSSTKYSPFFLMFGRHARTPLEMESCNNDAPVKTYEEVNVLNAVQVEVENDTGINPNIDAVVEKRMGETKTVHEEVRKNIDKAQRKQVATFAKRKENGVKTFDLSVGDLVYRRNMRNVGRKGGKMDPLWTGPYRIVDLDELQRVTLSSSKGDLNVKVPYDQLKPIKESNPVDNLITNYLPDDDNLIGNFMVDETRTEELPVITHKKRRVRNADVTVTGVSPKCPRKLGKINVTKQSNFQDGVDQMCQSITSGDWLTDEHINHAQATLRQSFPAIGGFQAVCVFEPEDCPLVGKPDSEFIQILNLGGNHWITVSNIHCNGNGQLLVYDSLYTGISDLSQPSRDKFLRQVSYILQSTSPELSIEWVDMKKQKGSSDCGLFAIAAVAVLCHGGKPQECDWLQYKMRSHLVRCFRLGCLSLFPLTGVRKCRKAKSHKVPIFCHCRQPEQTDCFMVQCDGCDGWYHRECEDMPMKITARTKFMCRLCKLA